MYHFLARAVYLPGGLYVLRAYISFFYIKMISKANLSQDLLDRFYDFHDFRNLFTNWYHLMIYVLFFFL